MESSLGQRIHTGVFGARSFLPSGTSNSYVEAPTPNGTVSRDSQSSEEVINVKLGYMGGGSNPVGLVALEEEEERDVLALYPCTGKAT